MTDPLFGSVRYGPKLNPGGQAVFLQSAYHTGLANAVLLPYVLAFKRAAIEEKLTTIASLLNLPEKDGAAVILWITELRSELAIPATLAELGIEESALSDIVALALLDAEHQTNPVSMDAAGFMQICQNAFAGTIKSDQ